MIILHAEGFDYRQTHVGIFQTPDGWYFDIHPVTQGEYDTCEEARIAARYFIRSREQVRRDRGRFPTVADRGVW